ncbi:MAG: hypothetical protein Kow0047_26940 [Anaerolineae bacterium]
MGPAARTLAASPHASSRDNPWYNSGMSPIDDAIDALQLRPELMRHIVAWRRFPETPGDYATCPESLHKRLREALHARGIRELYIHQRQAVEALAQGEHITVVTATASGKSLCYQLPILDHLLKGDDACALMMFPTKALAHDQLDDLAQWGRECGLAPGWVATYDGDTPRSQRSAIRRQARVVLTNPDMLHVGILPHHTQWGRFFERLRFVVLDEIHTYRGVFGSHVANVLRRLRRICRFYGSDPQFICTSATIANPADLAERLIESPVTLIDQDGAPRGERHFLIYDPPIVDANLGIRRSAPLEARRLAEHLLHHKAQIIIFARSRLTTELLVTYLRDIAEGLGLKPQAIRGYRGGYLPQQRREIEQGLRQGSVRAVVATNALELGVDIGQMEGAILCGYPGTIASTWQQVGRAGRRRNRSVAILVASASPTDQFLAHHPEYLFDRSPEQALIHPDNLVILAEHIRCAAFELPFRRGESFGAIQDISPILDMLAEEGVIHAGDEVYHWIAPRAPAEEISLRSASPDRFVIMARDDEQPATAIGEMERFSVPSLLHEGAIYLHEGQTYLVDQVDWEQAQAWVHPVEVDYYTEASVLESVRVLSVDEEAPQGKAIRAHGSVSVTSQAIAYRRVRRYTHENLGWGDINLPEQTLETTAFWLAFPEPVIRELEAQGLWISSPADYGPLWERQRELARRRDGFRCAHCGAPEAPDRQHDVHHLRPVKAYLWEAHDLGLSRDEALARAHQLENLVTLCPACHRRAEATVRVNTGLSGLGYVLNHVASLHLMTDPRDLGVLTEDRSPNTGMPTVTLYERIPAGIGLSVRLFELIEDVLRDCEEAILQCECSTGCPACIGPVLEQPMPSDPKALTLALLRAARPMEDANPDRARLQMTYRTPKNGRSGS